MQQPAPIADSHPSTPPPAVRNTLLALRNPRPNTPRFNPEIHLPEVDVLKDPIEMDNDKEDSFLEKVISRSPIKHANAHISDSVDAIDALEEALEEIHKAIPLVDDSMMMMSKSKSNQLLKQTKKDKPTVSVQEVDDEKLCKPEETAAPKRASPRKKTKPVPAPKPATHAANTKAKISTTTAKPKPGTLAKPVRPTPSATAPAHKRAASTTSAALKPAPAPIKRRPISSVLSPPPPPAKSTKPPTRPTFQLPGEAISRKLKEQREERIKQQQEEEAKKREFKAKPVRKSIAPVVVRGTTASRARQSLALGRDEDVVSGLDRLSLAGGESKRSSSIAVNKRPVSVSVAPPALTRKPSTTVSKPGPLVKSTVTAADAVQQRMKAREIFGRDRQEKEERERIKREKEAAAKKAREEAAERGRQASREWAEKQKKALAAKAGGEKAPTVKA